MMKSLMTASAAIALLAAAPATAQEADWGNGAAYGGARILTGDQSFETKIAPAATERTSSALIAQTPAPLANPQGRIGECYARIITPARYHIGSKSVKVADAYTTLSVTQPEFAPDTTRIVVREEYIQYKVRQPKWDMETETVTVRPEYERLSVTPAKFRFVNETIDLEAPRLIWKVGAGLSEIERTDPMTGAVYSLVEEPGEPMTIRKRTMTQPEQVKAISVPAQTVSVTKRVLKDKGGVDEVLVPAQYRDINIQKMVAAARPVEKNVPAEMKTVETKTMLSPEKAEWTQVLCDADMQPSLVAGLQAKLSQTGHYKGAIDAEMGPATAEAVNAFQQDNGLAPGGQLTLSTLKRLGVAMK